MKNLTKQTIGKLGVNLLDDPTEIQDEELAFGKNLWPGKNGILGKRPSMDFARNISFPQSNFFLTPLYYNIHDWCFSELCPSGVVALVNAYLGDSGATGAQDQIMVINRTIDGSTVVTDYFTKKLPFSVGSTYQLIQHRDRVLLLSESGSYILTWSGLATDITKPSTYVQAIPFSVRGDFIPKRAAYAHGRMILGNLGPGYERQIIWSDPVPTGDPLTSFPINATGVLSTRLFEVGATSDGAITAMFGAANAPEQFPNQAAVFVFFKKALYTLLGQPGLSTDTDVFGSLQIVRSNVEGCGCVAQRTIAQTPYGLIWLGLDDVWFLPFGNEPYPIGTKIRPYLQNQPPSMQYRLHAAYYDGAYRLALFKDGQGPTEYDAPSAQFWLDLRHGPPESARDAKWYGPMEYNQTHCGYGLSGNSGTVKGTLGMQANNLASGDNKLYTLLSTYLGAGGTPYNFLNLASLDGSNERDTCAIDGTPIPWQASTGYSLGDQIIPCYGAADDEFASTIWICTQAGTSGATEPAWNGFAGALVVDNTVRWRILGDDATATSPYNTSDMSNCEAPSSQLGNGIYFKLVSKEWTDPGPAFEKLITSGYITLAASDFVKLRYRFLTDTSELLKTLDPDGASSSKDASQLKPFRNNISLLGTNKVERRWVARQLSTDPDTRTRENSFQIVISDESPTELYLPEDRRTFAFMYKIGAGPVTAVTVALPSGVASSTIFSVFLDAINLGTAMGSVFSWAVSAGRVNVTGLTLTGFGNQAGFPFRSTHSFGGTGTWDPSAFPTIFTSAQLETNAYILGLMGYNQPFELIPNPTPDTEYSKYSYYRDQVSGVVFKDLMIRYRAFRRNPL